MGKDERYDFVVVGGDVPGEFGICQAPTSYCVAGFNSLGSQCFMGSQGDPSVTNPFFQVGCSETTPLTVIGISSPGRTTTGIALHSHAM